MSLELRANRGRISKWRIVGAGGSGRSFQVGQAAAERYFRDDTLADTASRIRPRRPVTACLSYPAAHGPRAATNNQQGRGTD